MYYSIHEALFQMVVAVMALSDDIIAFLRRHGVSSSAAIQRASPSGQATLSRALASRMAIRSSGSAVGAARSTGAAGTATDRLFLANVSHRLRGRTEASWPPACTGEIDQYGSTRRWASIPASAMAYRSSCRIWFLRASSVEPFRSGFLNSDFRSASPIGTTITSSST